MAITNLKAADRFKKQHIFLPIMCRSNVVKNHGMARIVCGVDALGVQHDEANLAQDLRELYDGRRIQIPDDINGGVKSVCPLSSPPRSLRLIPSSPPSPHMYLRSSATPCASENNQHLGARSYRMRTY